MSLRRSHKGLLLSHRLFAVGGKGVLKNMLTEWIEDDESGLTVSKEHVGRSEPSGCQYTGAGPITC